jgi:hypothetical protein
MKFHGSENYVATPDLMLAVNAAAAPEAAAAGGGDPAPARRCWPRGGTGAEHAAAAVAQVDHRAQQGLYEYDAVSRLRDSQLGDGRSGHPQLHRRGVLAGLHRRPAGGAADRRDHEDDIEFPNDLLRDRPHGVLCVETRELVKELPGRSSSSPRTTKELPDAFLRRCFFHYIKF